MPGFLCGEMETFFLHTVRARMVKVPFPLRGGSGPASRRRKLLLIILRPATSIRTCPKYTTISILGVRAPWPRTFLLFRKRRESAQRKKPPPSHCGLKFWLVTTLRRARSARSNRPTVDAASQNFSLRVPASVPMGGETAPVPACSFSSGAAAGIFFICLDPLCAIHR